MREIVALRTLDPELPEAGLEALSSAMDHLGSRDKRYRVRFITFLSKSDPTRLFEEWRPRGFRAKIQQYNDFALVRLRREIVRSNIEDGRREVTGEFAVYKRNRVWTAFTSDGPDFFHLGLIRYLESYRPRISKIFLSSKEMRGVLQRLSEDLDCEIIAQKAVLYSHEEEGQITFEKKPYLMLFNFAENNDMFVDKIEFKLLAQGKIALHAFLSRQAITTFHSGKSAYLFRRLIPLLVGLGRSKDKLFTDKGRALGELLLKPIQITYEKDVLGNPSDSQRLIRALGNLGRAAITVYHSNPYVHVSLLDFVDGSNFDIYSGESDNVTIVPNFNCTVHSLMRVHEQINRDFHEGHIMEAEDLSYSMSDFIE